MEHILHSITATQTLLSPLGSGQFYLDPGSGSLLIQVIIAGTLGALFALRASWGKIKSFAHRVFSTQDKEPNDE